MNPPAPTPLRISLKKPTPQENPSSFPPPQTQRPLRLHHEVYSLPKNQADEDKDNKTFKEQRSSRQIQINQFTIYNKKKTSPVVKVVKEKKDNNVSNVNNANKGNHTNNSSFQLDSSLASIFRRSLSPPPSLIKRPTFSPTPAPPPSLKRFPEPEKVIKKVPEITKETEDIQKIDENPKTKKIQPNFTFVRNSRGEIPTDSNFFKSRTSCNCKNSKCLKLYCDCLRKDGYCSSMCRCENCRNNPNDPMRKAIGSRIRAKNPFAFQPIVKEEDVVIDDGRKVHAKGCNCKKSGCVKNYCECHQYGVVCGKRCKCVGCKNQSLKVEKPKTERYGASNVGVILRQSK